jgi:C4-dicarboxylate transporter, DctM subunit
VVCNIANISLEEVSRAVLPFVLIMIAALAIIIAFPALSTYLPALFKLS